MIWLIPGFVALIVGIILVSPFFLAALARMGRRSPIAIRLPLRDMSRYRARSGSALAAISVGVLIAVVICAVAVARYSNVFDYVGPNVASNELIVYTPHRSDLRSAGGPDRSRREPAPSLPSQENTSIPSPRPSAPRTIVELVSPSAACRTPVRTGGSGTDHLRGDAGALAGLWHQPGVHPVQRRRPHLPAGSGGLGRGAHLRRRRKGRTTDRPGLRWPGGGPPGRATRIPATAGCVVAPRSPRREPAAQRHLGAEHGDHRERPAQVAPGEPEQPPRLDVLTRRPITSAQITNARTTAAANDLTIESKNDAPTSSEIVNWATVFGIALALGILAMSVGLIRSETASDLRTLAATGASSRTRRSLTAVTAGGLAFLGALLGTLAAYVGLFGWFRSNSLEGGVSDIINHVPWSNLFLIVIAMPIAATVIGWVLAGREPGYPLGRRSKGGHGMRRTLAPASRCHTGCTPVAATTHGSENTPATSETALWHNGYR